MDLELIVRTSLLLALAAILARSLHKAAPATRHLVWHLAIVLVVLAPLLAPLAPTITVPTIPVPTIPVPTVPAATPGTLSTVGTHPLAGC